MDKYGIFSLDQMTYKHWFQWNTKFIINCSPKTHTNLSFWPKGW